MKMYGEVLSISKCSPQHLKPRIACYLLNHLKAFAHGWLIFQEAVRYKIKSSPRAHHLRGLADEAFGYFGGLDAAYVKGGIGHDQRGTLLEQLFSPAARQALGLAH